MGLKEQPTGSTNLGTERPGVVHWWVSTRFICSSSLSKPGPFSSQSFFFVVEGAKWCLKVSLNLF